MNYFDDPHDMRVMIAMLRKALDVVANWPAHREIGPLLVPPALAAKHSHSPGDTPSDDLLEDLALHYSWTVYHPTIDLSDRQRGRRAPAGRRCRQACGSPTPASCPTS